MPIQRKQVQSAQVSVCMATYNGARFIREQLSSILTQLEPDDEIVVVDDDSRDDTIAILESFVDRRIRIIKQTSNCGILKTFERALNESTGDIIFLADQDDVWRPDKVETIKHLLARHEDVSLVISDFSVIDSDGNTITKSHFATRPFHAGAIRNVIRNRYQGSAMAFRRTLLEFCLPLPDDLPMHDMWIGIVNQFIGKVAFIPEPLTCYRRHERNASPRKHAPLLQMLRWRWALLKNLILLYLRRVKPREAK